MFSHICPQYCLHDVHRSSTFSTAGLRANAVAELSTIQIFGLDTACCSSVHFCS